LSHKEIYQIVICLCFHLFIVFIILITPTIFDQFPQITAGFSTKEETLVDLVGLQSRTPAVRNQIKQHFCNKLKIKFSNLARTEQIHSNKILKVTKPGFQWKWDALITDQKDIFPIVFVADCAPILWYAFSDSHQFVFTIHSGRKWTRQNIVQHTIDQLKAKSIPLQNVYVRLWPCISQKNYQFGLEVFDFFDQKYILTKDGKHFLDNKSAVYDQLLSAQIPAVHIETSPHCNYDHPDLYSYREDKIDSHRRMYWVIGITDQ